MLIAIIKFVVTVLVFVALLTFRVAKMLLSVFFDFSKQAKANAPARKAEVMAHVSKEAEKIPGIVGNLNTAVRRRLQLVQQAADLAEEASASNAA